MTDANVPLFFRLVCFSLQKNSEVKVWVCPYRVVTPRPCFDRAVSLRVVQWVSATA